MPLSLPVFADNEESVTGSYAESVFGEGTVIEGSGDGTESPEDDDDLIYSGDFGYSLTIGGTASIGAYKGSDTVVEIPAEIDGIPVSEIDSNAFVLNGTVTSITIPASVDYISGNNPFRAASALKEINADPGNIAYCSEDGILYNKDKTELKCYPAAKSGSTFTVPDTVEIIGVAAFSGCQLTEIKLSSALTETQRHSFSECSGLTSIDFSGTKVEDIQTMSFAECENLSRITFPATLTQIGAGAFVSCHSLEDIELPDGLLSIGQNAFADTALMKAEIPSSVQNIGYCAFGYDAELQPIEDFRIIGETGSAAQVYATDSDEEYDYYNNFTFMTPEQAESYAEYESLDVKESGNYMYAEVDGEAVITAYNGAELTIEVPSEIEGLRVTRIFKSAFYSNQAEKIILPETIKTIDELAFLACTYVKEITIPAGIETIGDEAFEDCVSLEKITIGGTCREIGFEPFYGCGSLKEIVVTDGSGGDVSSQDGVLFNGDKSVILAYPPAKETKKYKVPSSVREIRLFSFVNCKKLESVDLSGVESIGDSAFENCTSLKSVKLSKSLKTVGNYAFYGCTSLMKVRVYSETDSIGDQAFGFFYNTSPEPEETTNILGQTTTQSEDEITPKDDLIKGFKLYADKDSLAAKYCDAHGVELVTGTIGLFGVNVDIALFAAIGAIIAAAIIAIAGFAAGRSVKRKKAEKAEQKRKEESAEKRRKVTEKGATDKDEN